MFRVYRRLSRTCTSINQLNRLFITFERKLTPLQFVEFLDNGAEYWQERPPRREDRLGGKPGGHKAQRFSRGQRNEQTRSWIHKWKSLFDRSGKPQPEPFRGRYLSRELMLYADPSWPTREKTLLVCFTGSGQRMMTPLAVFLQNLDARTLDVGLVFYPEDGGYYHGLPSISETFEEMLTNLIRLLPVSAYRRTVTLGVSAGAVPAVLMALQHDLPAALAVGISSPADKRWHDALGIPIGDLGKRIAARSSRQTWIDLLCGAAAPLDVRAARDWEGLTPRIRVAEISAPDEEVRHNVIMPFIVSGQFGALLQETILTEDRNETGRAEPHKLLWQLSRGTLATPGPKSQSPPPHSPGPRT